MDVALAVRAADLRRVDVRQPVVGDDLARHVEDQAAERVALVGVGVDAPVLLLEVLVDRRGDVDQRLAVGAQPRVAVAVDDVGARGVEVAGGRERVLDACPGSSRCPARRPRAGARARGRPRRRARSRLGRVEFAGRRAGAGDRRRDLGELERHARAVALDDARRQRRRRRASRIAASAATTIVSSDMGSSLGGAARRGPLALTTRCCRFDRG